MTKIINIKSINWSKLHIYFFYLFLLSIPFQTRKVFLTQYSFYSGAFTEYATFFIYASDVFLILALFFWLVSNPLLRKGWGCVKIVKNYLSFLPRIGVRGKLRQESTATINYSLCTKHRTKNKIAKLRKIQILLLAFVAWLIVNAIINNKYLEISVFQIIKFIELFLLLVYIYFNLANKKALIISLFVISLAGFLQSLIAIYQFIFQQSLFNSPILAKITGEAVISPQIPGIAKIVMDGEKIIRAYGTFPHSNVLGGFLVLSIIISIYLLLEHKYIILSRCKSSYIQFYNTKFKKSQAQTAISLIWVIVIFAQITALLFTFSRSAWAGFVISLAVLLSLLYIRRFRIVSRETISYATKNNIKKIDYNSQDVSRETISDNTRNNKNNYNHNNVSHETFLNFKRKLNCYLLAVFVSFLFISLFDHYFWTLQQGRLIFWLVLGMLLIDVRFRVKDNFKIVSRETILK